MLFRNLEKRSIKIKENLLDVKECKEFLENCGLDVNSIDKNSLKEATYFSCMRIMQDNISKLPLKLFKKTNNGIEKCNKHPLLNLLSIRPNRFMSASNFWKYIEFQRNHYGNAVVYIDTDRKGQIKALYPLDFSNLTIYIDNANILSDIECSNINNNTTEVWYVYTDVTGVEHKLRNGEVLHFIGQTQNGVTGLSVADYLKTIVQNNKYAQNYLNNYFKSGLQARGIVQYTADLQDNVAAKRIADRFNKMANGIKNAGKVLPLPLGFTFQPIQQNMADVQFLEINKYTTKQIMNAFGIKSFMLNDLEKSSYANITEQQKDFYISTLQSILNMYEQELNYKLFGLDSYFYFKFNVDSILRADLKTRYEAYRVGIQGGFLTPNEAREKEDMAGIDGGDKLICNGNMQYLKDVGAYYKNNTNAVEGGDTENEEGN